MGGGGKGKGKVQGLKIGNFERDQRKRRADAAAQRAILDAGIEDLQSWFCFPSASEALLPDDLLRNAMGFGLCKDRKPPNGN